MKRYLPLVMLAVVLAAANYLIASREHIRSSGRIMLLELAPVDPRSLIQGDYMALRYRMATQVQSARLSAQGRLVVRLDEHNVASYVRLDHGEPLQPDEHLLAYRRRGGIRLGAESFFFQEGQAKLYGGARYGELRVADNGQSVLVGLRGKDFEALGPPQ